MKDFQKPKLTHNEWEIQQLKQNIQVLLNIINQTNDFIYTVALAASIPSEYLAKMMQEKKKVDDYVAIVQKAGEALLKAKDEDNKPA